MSSSSSSEDKGKLLRDAREHLSRSEFSEALACCKSILSADPKNYTALVFAGKAGFGLGKHAQAVAPYRAAIGISPNAATAYFGLLEVFTATRDAASALPVVAQLLDAASPLAADAAVKAKRGALLLKRAVLLVWAGDLPAAIAALDSCARDVATIDDALARSVPPAVTAPLDAVALLPDDATRFEIAALAARLTAAAAVGGDDAVALDARLLDVAQLAVPGSGRGDAWLGAWLRRALRRGDDAAALRARCAALVADKARPLLLDAVEVLLVLEERAALGSLHARDTADAVLARLLKCVHSFPLAATGRLGVALMLLERLERVCDAGVQVLPRDHAAILAPSPANPLDAAHLDAQAIEAVLFHALQTPLVRSALAQLRDVPLVLASVPARHLLLIGRASDALAQLKQLRATLEARALPAAALAHWSTSLAVLEARAHIALRNVDAAVQLLTAAASEARCDDAAVELVALQHAQRLPCSAALLDEVLARNAGDWRAIGLRGLLANDVAAIRRAGELAPPNDYRPHYWLGEALLATGAKGEGACEALLRAAELNRNHALLFDALGRYYRDRAHDRARAVRCFTQATRLDATLRSAVDALAQLHAANNAPALAADVYGEAARADATLLWAWEQRALFLLEGVREIDARNPATLGDADRQRATRWTNDALTSLQNALRVDEKRALLWQVLAATYARLGKFAAAIKAARRAHELDGTAAMPRLLLAQLLLDVGDVANAAAAFGDAGASVPAFIGAADAWLRASVAHDRAASVGHAVLARSRARRALTALEGLGGKPTLRALQLDGDVALLDAVAQRDAGARKAAMAYAIAQRVALVRQNATNPWSFVLLGHALLLAATHDAAAGAETNAARAQRSREALMRALRLAASTDKPDASLAPLLGALWVSLGVACAESPLVAQHCFVHALRMDQRSAVAWTNLGYLYASRQRLGLAADALERACTLKPNFAPAWVASATVRELLASRLIGRGRVAEAQAEWRVALHAYFRAVDMAATDALTGAMSDASPSASSVTSATGSRAALRAARVGVAACSVALRRSGDAGVDLDRALLAVQQVALEDAADVDVLNLLGVCSALRGQFGAALGAFRRALDIATAAAADDAQASEFDLQRSLLPSVSVVSRAQRRAVLCSNAVIAALHAGEHAAVPAIVDGLMGALDLLTLCRVALALARTPGKASDAVALANLLRQSVLSGKARASAADTSAALVALSAVCSIAGDKVAARECISICCQLFPSAAAWRRLAVQAALEGDRDTVLFVLGSSDYVTGAARDGPERAVREAQLLTVLGERERARALVVRGVHERPDVGALWQELWIDGTHTAERVDAERSDIDLGLACRAGLSRSARAAWWTDDELSAALLRLGATEGLTADVAHASAVTMLERRVRDSGSWALVPGTSVLLLASALRAHAVLQPSDTARWHKLAATLASWRATKRSVGSAVGDLHLRLLAAEAALYDETPRGSLSVAECVAIEAAGLLPAAAVASVRARTECAMAQHSGGSVADVLRAAIRRQPALCELWLLLGDHYAGAGQHAAAAVCAETALALPQLSERERRTAQLHVALHQLNARKYDKASEAASAAAKLAPRSAVAHLLRAVALLRAGADASLIFAALQACLLLDSEQAHARYLLAFVLLQLEDLPRALAHGERLLVAQPDMARANHIVARVLAAQAANAKLDGASKSKLLKRAEALLRHAVTVDSSVADYSKELQKIEKQRKSSEK